jgi:7-keto-8-aminopelargonate synthetase-like enzyme
VPRPAGERRRQDLRTRLLLFADQMPELFPPARKIQSAILPIILGSSKRALEAMRIIGEAGYYVPAIRFPTVPRETARLRVTLSARHTPEQIKGLCSTLRKYLAGLKAADAAEAVEV